MLSSPATDSRKSVRARAADDPVERRKHVLIAEAVLIMGRPRRSLAILYGVDARTIGNWIAAAVHYPEGRHLPRG